MKPTPARTLTRGRRPLGVVVTFFLLLVTALGAPPVSHAADTPVNLARNSGARAVASYEDGDHLASSAIDGIGSSRWSSDHSNDPSAWIYVDLGAEYAVSSAVLTWESAYAKAYRIQVSDDSTHWTDAYSTTDGHGGTETVALNENARYVRMQGVTPATQYGYSLWEFAVYGTVTDGAGTDAVGSPTVAPSTTYPTTYSDWQNGLLAGNGKQGVIVFGNPRNDTVVFDDKDFFMSRTEARPHRTFNTVSQDNINKIRDQLIAGQYQQANQLAADVQGYQGGGEGSKHPGYKMTLQMPDAGTVSNYVRSTDYAAGVLKVNWTDDKGSWERDSFVSRTDGATVQYQAAPPGQKETVTLDLSIDPGMNLLNKGVTYTTNNTTDYLNLRAKYPNGSYNAGYEGVTRIVTDGTKALSNGQVTVSNASYVLLLSLTQRYNGTYNGGVTAEQEWNKNLLQQKLAGLSTNYQTLLNRHVAKHSAIFDRVSLDFGATPADRAKSTEQLLAEQKSSSTPVPALYERMFYAGRYHLLGSSNETAAPDLLGNWTGDSNVGWDGYYHLDANLNLQISSGNIGNMPEAMAGYFWLNQQWQKDFETNAKKLLGTRGMLTGGNTPNAEGLISNINYDYPYQYVTGGESWLLYPFWEYYETTGDKTFLADKYYPLIRDMGDFYEDFLVKKDGDGNYIFAGSISPENTPPGGTPLSVNSVYDISGARFALTTLIQTAKLLGRDAAKIPVWQEKLDHLPPYLINNDGALAEWAWPDLQNKNNYQHRHSSGLMPVWPYREITPETNLAQYKAAQVFLQKKDQGNYENAGHGLLHGALIAADLNQADSVGAKLLRFAKDGYYYNSMATSHYNNHNTFATDVVNSVPTVMMEMLASTGPGTLELLPALPKGLDKGSISGMLGKSQFTIDNLAWDTTAHTARVTLTSKSDQNLTLIQRSGISSITGDGVSVQSSPLGAIARVLPLKAGETVTVNLTMNAPKANLAQGKPATASSQSSTDQSAAKAFDGDLGTRWSASQDPNNWIQVDLGSTYSLSEVDLLWEASFAKSYKIQGSTDGSTWHDLYSQPNSTGGSEKIPISGQARYLRMQGSRLSGQWGYSLYEMQVYG
ncbi:discoidin domain-containing protein [Streptomyces sp. NPDC049097]|uniref:glycosyl hydrolase family 95 catalytic domain-containing protein n=1 Tax=Streptomyces sp. NPDC049097 TaxID=3155497 RepID=UPI003415C2E1